MKLRSAEDLDAYRKAYKLAVRVFALSRSFFCKPAKVPRI